MISPSGDNSGKTSKASDSSNSIPTIPMWGVLHPSAWMNSRSFLKQLRKDNIELSLIQSELSELRDHRHNLEWRDRILAVIRSNHMQLFMCVLVLIDALIVITEIILEIHSMKNLKESYRSQYLLAYRIVRFMFPQVESGTNSSSDPQGGPGIVHVINFIQRQSEPLFNGAWNCSSESAQQSSQQSPPLTSSGMWHFSTTVNLQSGELPRNTKTTPTVPTKTKTRSQPSSEKSFPYSPESLIYWNITSGSGIGNLRRGTMSTNGSNIFTVLWRDRAEGGHELMEYDSAKQLTLQTTHELALRLHEISHVLHYISIGILSLFLLEVVLKVICLRSNFFKGRFEMVDALIIITSFTADIIFVHLASQELSLMVGFLLWRVVRVINGLLMHEKQRDEFRITLQKKARRMLDMKLRVLQQDNELLEKHIHVLEEFCVELGASHEQLRRCKPRYIASSKHQSSHALKSIAALTTEVMGGLVGAPSLQNDLVGRYGANPHRYHSQPAAGGSGPQPLASFLHNRQQRASRWVRKNTLILQQESPLLRAILPHASSSKFKGSSSESPSLKSERTTRTSVPMHLGNTSSILDGGSCKVSNGFTARHEEEPSSSSVETPTVLKVVTFSSPGPPLDPNSPSRMSEDGHNDRVAAPVRSSETLLSCACDCEL